MKKRTVLLLGLILAMTMQSSYAQQRGGGGRPPRGEDRMESQSLTDEQKEQIIEIVSAYDPEALTEEDARAIHDSFREMGVRGGPEMAEVLIEAGFDPRTLRDLAPPPPRPGCGDSEETKGV